jgi:hypothetical protein
VRLFSQRPRPSVEAPFSTFRYFETIYPAKTRNLTGPHPHHSYRRVIEGVWRWNFLPKLSRVGEGPQKSSLQSLSITPHPQITVKFKYVSNYVSPVDPSGVHGYDKPFVSPIEVEYEVNPFIHRPYLMDVCLPTQREEYVTAHVQQELPLPPSFTITPENRTLRTSNRLYYNDSLSVSPVFAGSTDDDENCLSVGDMETPASEVSTDISLATPIYRVERPFEEEAQYQCPREACNEVYSRRCDLK